MEDKKITVPDKIIRHIVNGNTALFHMSNGGTITIEHAGNRITMNTADVGIGCDEFNHEIVIGVILKPQTKKKNKFRFKT